MAYDFDQVIDRRHTDSAKWCRYNKDGHEDVLPLWVADMDFAAPEPVIQALQDAGIVLPYRKGIVNVEMDPDKG